VDADDAMWGAFPSVDAFIVGESAAREGREDVEYVFGVER
jgi:hypothetical protein